MNLLKLTDSTNGDEIVIVPTNIFAIIGPKKNEFTGKDETRIYGAGDDFFGVSETKQVILDVLSKLS